MKDRNNSTLLNYFYNKNNNVMTKRELIQILDTISDDSIVCVRDYNGAIVDCNGIEIIWGRSNMYLIK